MKWFLGIIITLVAISLILVASKNAIATHEIVNDSIDSLQYTSQVGEITELSFQKCKESIIETKNFILNSNTISYLFQVLTILIISIGFYLLSKIQSKYEQIGLHEKRIVSFLQDVKKSSEIVNTTNTILSLSTSIDENDPFSNLNIQNAFLIEDQLKIIITLFDDPNTVLSPKQKEYCQIVIEDFVKSKFNKIGQSEDGDYFEPVLDSINDLVEKIHSLKTRDTTARTLYM